jgi:hypothetical protein
MAVGRAPSRLDRTIAFFRRHPILLFLAFTPGIPEYLSGSSPVYFIVVSPGAFVVFLALNLGLYGPGALLAREAYVRWRPGWAGAILLGSAYGLLEEGTALSTLFNPHASVVGDLGFYGHALGVNWVWLFGILGVHIIFSVGLPILLLGLALPETRGRSLLTGRQVPIAMAIYAADIVALVFIIGYYRTAPGLLLAAALVAVLLYAVTYGLSGRGALPIPGAPRAQPRTFAILGLLIFPSGIIIPGLGESARAAPALSVGLMLSAWAVLLALVASWIGTRQNERELLALAMGTLAPLMLFGALSQITIPVVLALDAAVVLFFLTLWRAYSPAPIPGPTPGTGAGPPTPI